MQVLKETQGLRVEVRYASGVGAYLVGGDSLTWQGTINDREMQASRTVALEKHVSSALCLSAGGWQSERVWPMYGADEWSTWLGLAVQVRTLQDKLSKAEKRAADLQREVRRGGRVELASPLRRCS